MQLHLANRIDYRDLQGERLKILFLLTVIQLAAAAQPAASFRDCSDCPERVRVPGGTFMMGSPSDEIGRSDMEGPQHSVTIRPFAVGKFHVTRAQWAAFVAATQRATTKGCFWTGRTGNKMDPEGSWRNLGFEQDDTHPVVCVTWRGAQDYVAWLSERTGHPYRLLTEAEWEYAARTGSTTPFPWGSTASHVYANYGTEDFRPLAIAADRWEYTSPVGSFPPNALGLYDMPGNALQWVQDCYATYDRLPSDGSAYETDIELTTGVPLSYMVGTRSCSYRMLRGGDWGDPSRMMRSAFRNFGPGPGATLQDYRSGGVGFRVARDVPSAASAQSPNQVVEATKTNANHRLLASTVGNWSFSGKHTFPNGAVKPFVFSGTAEKRALWGGRYFVTENTGGGKMKMPWSDELVTYQDMVIEAYDNARSTFTLATFNNETETGIIHMDGVYNRNSQAIAYECETASHFHVNLPPSTVMKIRVAYQFVDVDHFTMQREESVDGKTIISTELKYTRLP